MKILPADDDDSRRRKKEPHVGIFWLVNGKLVMDSTSLSISEDYGGFKIHPADHCSVWERLQRSGAVPAGMEYEECPRGRVMYDTKARRFSLLADTCILKNKGVIRDIISKMNLPGKNKMETDSHYRCFRCLQGRTRVRRLWIVVHCQRFDSAGNGVFASFYEWHGGDYSHWSAKLHFSRR